MGAPGGFDFQARKNGDVAITHHGRPAAVLRKAAAARFVRDVGAGGEHQAHAQEVMAKVTGNYKRGNERRNSGAH